jgi:hypothetical protein
MESDRPAVAGGGGDLIKQGKTKKKGEDRDLKT